MRRWLATSPWWLIFPAAAVGGVALMCGVQVLLHSGSVDPISAIVVGIGLGGGYSRFAVLARRRDQRITGRDAAGAYELRRCLAERRVPDDPADRVALLRLAEASTPPAGEKAGGALIGAVAVFLVVIGVVLAVFAGVWPWLPTTVAVAVAGGLLTWLAARDRGPTRADEFRERLSEGVGHG
jgi:hypothetical protein